MSQSFLQIKQSLNLQGQAQLFGAKNASLVIMASLLLTEGKSKLSNLPCSADILNMVTLLRELGATVTLDVAAKTVEVDTSTVNCTSVSAEIMKKMRASILVMGPLLARFGTTDIANPGGCTIGSRPIDYHLHNFRKMGAIIHCDEHIIRARAPQLVARDIILDYPSVGATENIMLAATLTPGKTRIVNAALEPEVFDLIAILQAMGAHITITPATITIEGVSRLKPVTHTIMPDRLEAGALLLAAAVTGGHISLPQARSHDLEIFLVKLEEMGHTIAVGHQGTGITLTATDQPVAVSFKTGPFPGFPTDLQAPMMVAQCLADGVSHIEETVFEDRISHAYELARMGANIQVFGNKAVVTGKTPLQGIHVNATNIRASCALVLAGLVAEGATTMSGVHHWIRGYESLETKLSGIGASITVMSHQEPSTSAEAHPYQAQLV